MTYSRPSPYRIILTPGMQEDLRGLLRDDQEHGGLINALVRELNNGSASSERMDEHLALIEGTTLSFDVREIKAFRSSRPPLNLWGIKVFSADIPRIPYRIIYAPQHQQRCYYLLGIMKREIDYDPRHPFFARVATEYDEAGIPYC